MCWTGGVRRCCESPCPVRGRCGGTRWAGPLTQPSEKDGSDCSVSSEGQRRFCSCSPWVAPVTRLRTAGVPSAGRWNREADPGSGGGLVGLLSSCWRLEHEKGRSSKLDSNQSLLCEGKETSAGNIHAVKFVGNPSELIDLEHPSSAHCCVTRGPNEPIGSGAFRNLISASCYVTY